MPKFVVILSLRSLLRLSRSVEAAGAVIQPDEYGLQVTKIVEAKNPEDAEAKEGSWCVALSEAIALVTKHSANPAVKGSAPITDPLAKPVAVRFHAPAVPRELEIPITRDEILKAVDILPKIQVRRSETDPWRRALTWYVRGVNDKDPIDRFVDYWIGMETLASSYKGSLSLEKCPSCGKRIEAPVRGRIEGLLRDLKVAPPTIPVKELLKIRVQLFHSAKALAAARTAQTILSGILRECLINSLGNP